MRRLLLAAALLVLPAVAHADGLPGTAAYPTYYLSGCSNELFGCITGEVTPMSEPGRYHAGLFNACDESAILCSLRYHVALYDANANLIYRYGNGDVPGYMKEGAVPLFGIAELSALHNPDGSAYEPFGTQMYVPLAVTTTPEPLTLVLLGTGLLAVVLVGRTRFA